VFEKYAETHTLLLETQSLAGRSGLFTKNWPLWVIRDRGESAASLAMSAMAPKAEINSEH
jgi:hypothetical protein